LPGRNRSRSPPPGIKARATGRPASARDIAAYPALHQTPGPHGISLLSHTIAGKKQSFDAFLLLLNAGAYAAAWRGSTPLMHAVAMSERIWSARRWIAEPTIHQDTCRQKRARLRARAQ
jgi:hypothetical protein